MLFSPLTFHSVNILFLCIHLAIDIQFLYAVDTLTRIRKITVPFGNRYLCTLIQLKRFSLCPFHFIHIHSDHVKRKYTLRHDGFPFGSICSPKRLIILCTRYTENILFKYNQGMPVSVQTMFLFLFNVI